MCNLFYACGLMASDVISAATSIKKFTYFDALYITVSF